jgi:ectoine hydroxylase-related dioxygenase (phytanoyl-CoA dioxygenase family)
MRRQITALTSSITRSALSEAGYSIENGVLTAVECDRLVDDLSYNLPKRGRAGARHLMSHPKVAALASEPRLLAIVRSALGADGVPYRATLFEKSGRANWLVGWHQDTALPLESGFEAAEWGPWSRKACILYARAPGWALTRIIALRVHLDASTADNGPLRVVPGSHRAGVLTVEEVFTRVRATQPRECLVDRGGVLAMRPLLIHSSGKARGNAPRRVLHIEYADSLDLACGIRLAIA